MTGEISIHGKVKPIGGVIAKVKAAKAAGVQKVIIPQENMQAILEEIKDITIIPVESLTEVLEHALLKEEWGEEAIPASTIALTKKESI